MSDAVSGTWTVQEYTCEWEPHGEPFEVRFKFPIVAEYAAELAAQRLAGREDIAADWGAVDGDVRYLELRSSSGATVRIITRAEVRVVYRIILNSAQI